MTALAAPAVRMQAPVPRHERLAQLAGGSFDVLVIGGGVVGASAAWAAARTGASVALVDQGDAAGATSSASSKLVHGGLRYLGLGDVRLVREAHRERRWNARLVAPHLVRPLRFILPVGPQTPYRATELRAGVFVYSALSGFKDGRSGRLSADHAVALAPGLRPESAKTFIEYHDHQTDDARLVLATLRTAEQLGVVWVNHAAVESLRLTHGKVAGAELIDVISRDRFGISARVVINATGPWIDHIRALEDPNAGTSIRLSKGAHLVLETDLSWQAAVTSPLPEGRVSFALPWHGMLLLGTTDEPFEGDPATVQATDADREQILTEASTSLSADVVRPDRVRAAFAGLRVLPLGGTSTAGTKRETVIETGRGGMISVAGGKLTTWRKIGIDVAGQALASIGHAQPGNDPVPLIGAADPESVVAELGRSHPGVSTETRRHLASLYGSLAHEVLEPAREDATLYEPIVPGAPDLLAQALYAVDYELAQNPDDVLRRRTTVSIRGLDEAARPRIARFLDGSLAA